MADPVKTNSTETTSDAWIDGVRSAEFKALIDAKRRSIAPLAAIYVVSYIGLSILAGFGRELLGVKAVGPINVGFILIIANYVMSWVIAVVYARVSARIHDPLVAAVVGRARPDGIAR
jgi:uncharacterized membrane protein (DUF485 family)